MRAVHLNMTMSLDGFVAGPHGELDWMTTAHDADLTADIVAQLSGVDEAFMGYPTAAGMIRYWADVAQDPDASQASRDIAHAVSDTHTFAISRTPEQIDVPNAEVVRRPRRPRPARRRHRDQTTTGPRHRPARRSAHRANLRPARPDRPIRAAHRTGRHRHRATTIRPTHRPHPGRGEALQVRSHPTDLPALSMNGSHIRNRT